MRGLVERIYNEVDPRLWPYAEQSTRAALDKLSAEQRLTVADDVVTLAVA